MRNKFLTLVIIVSFLGVFNNAQAVVSTFTNVIAEANALSSAVPAILLAGGVDNVVSTIPGPVVMAGGIDEVKAYRELSVNSLPTAADTITIGDCVVTFSDAGDDIDELDCNDNIAGVSRTTATGGPGTARSATQIADKLQHLLNIWVALHGFISVTEPGLTDVGFITTGSENSATSITFTDGTTGAAISSTTTDTPGVVGVVASGTATIPDGLCAGSNDHSIIIDGITIHMGHNALTDIEIATAATSVDFSTGTSYVTNGAYTIDNAGGTSATLTITRNNKGVAGNVNITILDPDYVTTNGTRSTDTITIPAGLIANTDDHSIEIDDIVIDLGHTALTAEEIADAIVATNFDLGTVHSFPGGEYTVTNTGADVTFTKDTVGVAGDGAITVDDIDYGINAMVIVYLPGTPTEGEEFVATINGTDYSYTVLAGGTVNDVVDALQLLMDVEANTTCTEDGGQITCTADVAGTLFTYDAAIVDTVAPEVAITLSDYTLTRGQTATITFTFSEAPTGFTDLDVTIENGTIPSVVATGDPLVYTATFTPTASVIDSTNIITVGIGWTDADLNPPASTTNSLNYIVNTMRSVGSSGGSSLGIPAVAPTIPTDCLSGYLFSPTTGKSCSSSSLSVLNPTTPSNLLPIRAININLYSGLTNDDVNTLQEFLVSQNKGPEALALKNHGTTHFFGPLTKLALAEWQKAMNISPAVGYFGSITRGVINGM